MPLRRYYRHIFIDMLMMLDERFAIAADAPRQRCYARYAQTMRGLVRFSCCACRCRMLLMPPCARLIRRR